MSHKAEEELGAKTKGFERTYSEKSETLLGKEIARSNKIGKGLDNGVKLIIINNDTELVAESIGNIYILISSLVNELPDMYLGGLFAHEIGHIYSGHSMLDLVFGRKFDLHNRHLIIDNTLGSLDYSKVSDIIPDNDIGILLTVFFCSAKFTGKAYKAFHGYMYRRLELWYDRYRHISEREAEEFASSAYYGVGLLLYLELYNSLLDQGLTNLSEKQRSLLIIRIALLKREYPFVEPQIVSAKHMQ
ncbi:hypothetical protein FACS1894184_06220 [Clostridia bacterium]|nr:hypothetical protein FACS1894184_06220 [Clostridia bacterium]